MSTTANQRIDVGALRNDDAVLTAEPATFHNREIDYPIDRIVVGERHRPLGDVSALAESMSNPNLGQLQAIVLLPDGRLVIGNHRVAAARLLGWRTIRATIKELDELDAELAEIDENLRRSELTVLEQGDHLDRREQILAARGQRAQPGHNQHNGGGDTVTPPPVTTAAIAGDMGISERSAQRRLQIARGLDATVKRRIAGTNIANSTSQLLELARMKVSDQQTAVEMVLAGGFSSVQHAAAVLALDPDAWRLLKPTVLRDNPTELAELGRLEPQRQRKIAALLVDGKAHSVRHGVALTQEPAKTFLQVPASKPTFLSVEEVKANLLPLLEGQSGRTVWECAAGYKPTEFGTYQERLMPLGRVRQHELIKALYQIAEERGIGLTGKAIDGSYVLPTWVTQTDDANSPPQPATAPPQGDSADSLTTPLDGVPDDDKAEGERVQDAGEAQQQPTRKTLRNDLDRELTDALLRCYWSKGELSSFAQSTAPFEDCRRRLVSSARGMSTGTWRIETGQGYVKAWHVSHGKEYFDREPDAVFTYDRFARMTVDLPEAQEAQAQHQAEALAAETAVNEATAPPLPPVDLPSHSDAETRVAFKRAGRASSNDLVQKHGYGFQFHPKPPYGDGMVELSHHDREAKIHRKLGVFATDEEACIAARRDLQERIAAAVPPIETPAAEPAGDEDGATATALPTINYVPAVPSDLASLWTLKRENGQYWMTDGFHTTPICDTPGAAFSEARKRQAVWQSACPAAANTLASEPAAQNGDPAAIPDAARSTWAYWGGQGWRLVRDSKLQTTTGVHDATGLATPTLISEAGVIHWLASGKELTEANYRVATKQPPSPADERNTRVKAMIETLAAARELIADYEKTTGIYSHSGALRQAVRPMIEMLERNLTKREEAQP